jgi:hypothetical protein
MKKLFFLIIFLSLSFNNINGEEKDKISSLEKSIVFPGWGQISEKRYLEGLIFAGSELFCLAEVFKNLREGNKYYELYKKAESTEDAIKFRDLTIKFDKRRNRFIAGAVAVWALNLIDMSIFSRKRNSLVLNFGEDFYEIGFRKEF